MIVQVPLVGETYESRTTALSNQVCINLYPEIAQIGRSPTALQSWPGNVLKTQGSAGDACRGMYNWNGTAYKVSGSTLSSFDSDGALTTIGSIAGSAQCVFASDQSNLFIATDGVLYQYNGTTLSTVTDADLGALDTITFINNQYIADNGGTDNVWLVSDAGNGASWSTANYGSAESDGDYLLRPYAFNQTLYLFGEKTIEPWYNSGVGSPPFDRVQSSLIQVGLGAKYSIASTDEFTYFVGDDKQVYKMVAYQTQVISSLGIANFLENNDISDAIGYTLTLEKQKIYLLILPTANKTLCYSETNNTWFELSTGVNGDRSRINSYVYCYGKHWVGDKDNGSLYQLDLTNYQDNNSFLKRERITQPINGDTLGQPGKILSCKSLHVTMRTGVGQISGDVNPHIVFQYSIDDGNSWSNEHWVKLGRLNEIQRIRFDHFATAREIRYRMYVTDNCDVSLHSAALDVEFLEW